MKALFFDTESTGVKSWKNPGFIPRLVQIGAILQDLDTGRVLGEINLIVEGSIIPVEASAVHGISTELANKVGMPIEPIDQVFARLLNRDDLVVAHNTPYDVDIVEDNLPISKAFLKTKPTFDTMRASTEIVRVPHTEKQVAYFRDFPEKKDADYKHPNLTETYKHFFGVPFEGAHDAMADIGACRDIFMQLIERGYYVIEGNKIKKVEV